VPEILAGQHQFSGLPVCQVDTDIAAHRPLTRAVVWFHSQGSSQPPAAICSQPSLPDCCDRHFASPRVSRDGHLFARHCRCLALSRVSACGAFQRLPLPHLQAALHVALGPYQIFTTQQKPTCLRRPRSRPRVASGESRMPTERPLPAHRRRGPAVRERQPRRGMRARDPFVPARPSLRVPPSRDEIPACLVPRQMPGPRRHPLSRTSSKG
jgi:hypothetical protein